MFNLNSCVYLDNSATSRYKPPRVISQMEKTLRRSANPGRAGHGESIRASMKVEECREKVKDITFRGEVVFTKNCTEALNLAIFGLYKKGEIITSVYEHNSVLRPIEMLKSNGAKVTYLHTPSGIIDSDTLKGKITKNTTLVVLQEMSNVTGTIQPIESLGALLKEYGIPFVVDCAQSLGHLKTNYTKVDCLCAPGHKGLHGPQGTGFITFRKGLDLKPLTYGGTGTDSGSLLQPRLAPEGYESGTLNLAGIVGLKEGIEFTCKNFKKIERNITRLSVRLLDGLSDIKGVRVYSDAPNGVISFNLLHLDSTEVADTLYREYGICVRAGLHCAPLLHRYQGTFKQGSVRASIGYNNTEKDIELLIGALRALASKKPY